jgi:hypothetical protein
MNIVEATRRFEAWLRRQITVVGRDLDYKHEQMRADPFLFFRATFIAGRSSGRSIVRNWLTPRRFLRSVISTSRILARGAMRKVGSSGA